MKKIILLALIALSSILPAASQPLGQIEFDLATFQTKNIGILSFDVVVDQNLSDFSDRELQRLKVSLIQGIFGGEGLKLTASFLSLQRNADRITPEETYVVNQLQLISADITSVIPLDHGFKLTLTARAGLGFTVKGVLNSDNEMLKEAEYKLFEMIRDCTSCLKEIVRDAGYFPLEAGLRVKLNKNKTYLALSADYRDSSKYYGIPGDQLTPGESYRYRLYTTEEKSVTVLAAEMGQEFGPATIFGRAEYTTYRSAVDAEARSYRLNNYDERTENNLTFRVGLRVKFGLFGQR